MAKVRNWCAARTPAVSGGGAIAQPIFQPVSEKVLPSDESVTVRSAMPSSVARQMCSPWKTSRSYTSSVRAITSCLRHRAAIRSSSARLKTLPVGLCGVLTRMTRVRSEKARRSWASSRAKSGGRRVTNRGTAPAMATHAR